MQIDPQFPAALVFGAITAFLAHERGRSMIVWFLIGTFLPCIGIVLVLVLPEQAEGESSSKRTRLEARRLREQLRKERQVADARHATVTERLSMHDRKLGMDTRQVASVQTLGALPPVIGNPREVEWWYVQDGERMGPVGFQTLRSLYQLRDVDGQTLVWCESMADWELIAALHDLEKELCA